MLYFRSVVRRSLSFNVLDVLKNKDIFSIQIEFYNGKIKDVLNILLSDCSISPS